MLAWLERRALSKRIAKLSPNRSAVFIALQAYVWHFIVYCLLHCLHKYGTLLLIVYCTVGIRMALYCLLFIPLQAYV